MIDQDHDAATALSLLVARGLPDGAGTLAGTIERIGRFDESGGEIVPLTDAPLPAGSTLCVSGWAVDLQAKGGAAGVCLRVGDVFSDADYGERRDDGTAGADVDFVRTGFRGFITIERASAGELELAAVAVAADAGSMTTLSGGRTITVVAEPPATFSLPRRDGSASVVVDGWRVGSQPEVSPASALRAPRGSLISLRGWIRDVVADAPAAAVFALVDERDIVRGNVWQPRADVVAALGRDHLLGTGFTVRIDTAALAPGLHAVQIGMTTADGAAYDVDERPIAFAVVPDQR